MVQQSQKRVVFAGNHAATTALSVIEEIKTRKLPWDIYWLGNKRANEGHHSYSLEYNQLTKVNIKFIDINSGRVQNKFTRYSIFALLKLPLGFIRSGISISRIKPDIILSFGGATGAMAAFWGKIMNIPVVIHEQTASIGRANLFSSRFASVVAVSRESSKDYLGNVKKIVVTGNPIAKCHINNKSKSSKTLKTILITGGSRGSQIINRVVSDSLFELLQNYKIIHQVGEQNIDSFKGTNQNYKVYGQVSPERFSQMIESSDLVISRSGANTVSEILVHKKPSILIPIPWSYMNEQLENAKYLKKLGVAEIIEQDLLDKETLLSKVHKVDVNYRKIASKISKIESPDIDAASNLVNLLVELS